ncbi:MAG: MerR family transcriptional regulator [Acidimicrobiia bacterium]|nr:MerR family transcriptional regulator [Acidimicrobiia bacterium]
MSTYTIGEVADRSGFTASALRYYEGIGLVTPASRTGAGYRVYDEHTLARLAFIARAKQLGCSLEDITDLVAVWDGERCGPVQRRFHELVTDNARTAQRQIADLTTFAGQLRTAAAQLGREPVDGPCGDDCACVSPATGAPSAPTPVALHDEASEAPIACALQPDAMPERVAGWQALLGQASARTTAADGAIRVEFGAGADLGQLAGLVAAEQHCCAFFSFAITVDARGVGLEVRAPDSATDLVTSLFGGPA